MKVIALMCMLVTLLEMGHLNAQPMQINLEKEMQFDGTPNEYEFLLEVKRGQKELNLDVKGIVDGGSVKVLLFDPNGKKECKLVLKAKKGSKAKGVLGEALAHPKAGTWKLVVHNDGASGKLKFNFHQN